MTEAEAEALAHALVAEHRPDGFLRRARSPMALTIRWGRAASTLGTAQYPSVIAQCDGQGPVITLSRALWEHMPATERRDTVIHEVCHLLVADDWFRARVASPEGRFVARGAVPSPKAHGPEWKRWMRALGGNPTRVCRDEQTNAAARTILAVRRARAPKRLTCVTMTCGCPGSSYSVPLPRAARYDHEGPECARCRRRIYTTPGLARIASMLWRGAHGYYLPATISDTQRAAIASLRGAPDKVILDVAARVVALDAD